MNNTRCQICHDTQIREFHINFWLVTAGGGRGAESVPHHNFFVIGRIKMKLGKLVKCFKLYLLMGFWWVNWL